jgi:hypothetical protein
MSFIKGNAARAGDPSIQLAAVWETIRGAEWIVRLW